MFNASPFDIYLQPHSDDICFSLGALACKRHCGILLTVFSISEYMPNPKGAMHPHSPLTSPRPSSEWITRSRLNEDKAFAEACGLNMLSFALPSSSFLGHEPFDLDWVNQNQRRISLPLFEVLLTTAPRKSPRTRPWLFCPSGIGGHVDHVAIRRLVLQNYNLISLYYRIGFYEDLHYASDAVIRSEGIAVLRREFPSSDAYRYVFPFSDVVSEKLSLVHIYRSQFLSEPQSIDQFVPAINTLKVPHEAIWSFERSGPN
jgi:hypothetical protein